MENSQRSANLKKLWDKVNEIKIAMMTTKEDDGNLRSRPMYTQQTEYSDFVWFFTKDDSPKIKEIIKDMQVNLSYADPDDSLFVSVSGNAILVKDKDKAKELWNPLYKAWFPDGLDDPHLALIRVDVQSAEYWDSSSNKMVQLFGMVKAAATGKEYRPGENEKINLKR
jgi:general stress protein 26